MRRTAAVLAALLLLLLAAAPAQAASTSRKDGDDAISPLDMKKVTLKVSGKKLTVTVTMHDAFTDADLSGGRSGVSIAFEVGKKIRGIDITSPTGSGLVSDICTYPPAGPPIGKKCSAAEAVRVDDHSVRVTVARAKIEKGARSYRWNASSIWSIGDQCSMGLNPDCYDKVPGANRFLTWKP